MGADAPAASGRAAGRPYSRPATRKDRWLMASERSCPACAVANPAGARFCMACGAALASGCPAGGTEVPAQARVCMACGAALDGAATAAAAPADAAPSEERRTVTVLFADLSGYTAVSEQLDHETVKALTERCLNRLASEVERFGGRVDKYIGDNVMAVFGAPVAHEDDPERAACAAVGMQAAMPELNGGIGPEFGFELPLRIGVNTGEVLAGTVGDAYTVVGDAVNVAARLQAAAPVTPSPTTDTRRAHVRTSVPRGKRMPSSASKKKKKRRDRI